MKESIKLSEIFPVNAKTIFNAWLDSDEHAGFTSGEAEIIPRRGTRFTISDGYITGANLNVQPYGRIVQSWRTTEFPPGSADSNLELLFEKVNGGTRLTIIHTNIPEGQGEKYEKGWKEHYFKPMKKYFKKQK